MVFQYIRFYLLGGFLFGAAFPVIALFIRAWQYGQDQLINVIASDPLLWIIMTAPLILGGAAGIIGYRQMHVQRLADSLEIRSSVLSSSAEAVINLTLSGHVRFVNETAIKYLDVEDEEEVIGVRLEDLSLCSKGYEMVSAYLKRDHNKEQVSVHQEIEVGHQGRRHFYDLTVTQSRLEGMDVNGVTFTLRDITLRKEQEIRLNTLVENVSGGVNEVLSLSAQTADCSSFCQQGAMEGLRRTRESESVVRKLHENITVLSEIFSSIHRVTDFINDIARQTKLLSLNASVEAARAGSAGVGFGVVAHEIGFLSERTGKSVQDITEMLDQSVDQVKNGESMASQSLDFMNQLVGEINQLNDAVGEIREISHKQNEQLKNIHSYLK